MKFRNLLLAVALLTGFALPAAAQMGAGPNELPTDPEVRVGKLKNGLTYYIRHNEKPAGQADFYIAQKVGSIQENERQRGLAHFLEHMCFNGTKHFPDSMVTTWLESVGVKFGENLNAYTWVDQTVYNISSVPVARVGVQDSCLMVLRDWAGDLLLTTKEIDKQRGVIHEEWRMRGDANFRMTESTLADIYTADSPYATAMPIGTMEVIDNFPEQDLRDYYHTWYRPDLQAVMVVGDIDVDRIEAKIKEMFSDLKVPKHAPKREYPEVPDFEGTRYALAKDKEAQVNIIYLSFLSDKMPAEVRNTPDWYAVNYITQIIAAMYNERFQDITSKPDAPFAMALAMYGGFYYSTAMKDALDFICVPKEHDAYPAYEALYREVMRGRLGFTQSEYDRAKANYLASAESAYKNREATTNDQYVNEYVRNFLDGEPIPGAEIDWQLSKMLAENLPLEAINQVVAQLVGDNSRVVRAFMSETPDLVMPTPEGLEAIHAKVGGENIEGFVDEVRTDPLVPELPAPGKVVAESRDEAWDATVWTLSNGVKVVVRPTKFKEDQVLVKAVALGGNSMLPAEFDNAFIFDDAFAINGLGNYTSQDLQKYLAGKKAGVDMDFRVVTRNVEGYSTPKDLPTLMELIYMTFTAPNYDADEFKSMQNSLLPMLRQAMNQPEYKFQSMIKGNLFESPRRGMATPEVVEAVTPELYTEAVKRMLANAADYTFVFTGNLDLDALRPLVEQYIATLPADAATAVTVMPEFDASQFYKPGSFTVTEEMVMETPQTFAFIVPTADIPYSPSDALAVDVAGQVLTKRLIDKVRQQMGAVYSLGAMGGLNGAGPQAASIQSGFPMKPEMKNQVLEVIAQMFKDMETDITAEELSGVVEAMVKEYNEGLDKNEPWLSNYTATLVSGVDAYHTYLDDLAALTPEKVMDFMRRFNAQNGYKVILLDPKQ